MFESKSGTVGKGPDFLCVGMPKCGTSTLHYILREKTHISVPPLKEIKFFAADKMGYRGGPINLLFQRHWAARQERLALMRIVSGLFVGRSTLADVGWGLRFAMRPRNLDWYLSLFPDDAISGDISPAYHMLNDEEVADIGRKLPHLKIIILLRDPYAQLWSHCRMSARHGPKGDLSAFFEDQVEYQLELCRSYSGLVRRWERVFGSENVRVEYLENFQSSLRQVVEGIVSFVDSAANLQEVIQPIDPALCVFAGEKSDVPMELRAVLGNAAITRLEGFEDISPEWAKRWRSRLN